MDVQGRLEASRFVCPGVLWWALDWESADRQYAAAYEKKQRPFAADGWRPEAGSIVLIDEIDKAEAELPPAFLRRCLVLTLSLPRTEDEFIAFLMHRGEVHFGSRCGREILKKAARLIWNDRQALRADRTFIPGQAEYLDLLRAICEIEADVAEQAPPEQLLMKHLTISGRRMH